MGTPGPSAAQASSAVPNVGDVLDGKYALVGVLGEGGMGIVFAAEHLRLKQRCAIKLLSPAMLADPEIVRRFEREARASAQLRGPHVARVTDVATTSTGLPYIVMELLVGHDLDGELARRGTLPFAEAVDYVLQACSAVADAHAAGIVHRDLKPGNLFLAQEDDGVRIKVLDFGISKMAEEEQKLTTAGATMGTALYMSPEQIRSASKVDGRADIWSLGVILYELISGTTPFTGTVHQVAAAIVTEDAPDLTTRCVVPPPLAAVVHRMLQRDANARFASIVELAAALAPFAPEGTRGRAVAAHLARRASQRQLPSAPASQPSVPSQPQLVAEAPTVARVVTGVSHEVATSARVEAAPRRALVAALAAVGIIGVLGTAAVVVTVVHKKPPPAAAAVEHVDVPPTASPAPSPAPSPTVAPATTAEPAATAEPRAPTASASAASSSVRVTSAGPRASASAKAPTAPVLTAGPPSARPTSTPPPKSTGNPLFLN